MPFDKTAVCFHVAEWVCPTCGRCSACCNDTSHGSAVIHTQSKDFASLRRKLWQEQARIQPLDQSK